jgi:hypothetical protein
MIKDAMPARCQSCVPNIDCVFFLSDDDDSAYGYDDCCACPERARMIAIDVSDAAWSLRHYRVNLNDQAAIKAVLHPESEWVERAIENGSLDDFIERAVECAKARV